MNCYTWEEYEKLIYEEAEFNMKRDKIADAIMSCFKTTPSDWPGSIRIANAVMRVI